MRRTLDEVHAGLGAVQLIEKLHLLGCFIATALLLRGRHAVATRDTDAAHGTPQRTGFGAKNVEPKQQINSKNDGCNTFCCLHHGEAGLVRRGHGQDLVASRHGGTVDVCASRRLECQCCLLEPEQFVLNKLNDLELFYNYKYCQPYSTSQIHTCRFKVDALELVKHP